MNISLTAELEQFILNKVQSGSYVSASDVVHHGLRLLQEQEEPRKGQLQELRRLVEVSLGQLEKGDFSDYDDAALHARIEDIKSRIRPNHGTES